MRQTTPAILVLALTLGLAVPCAAQEEEEETSEVGLDSPSGDAESDEGEAAPETIEEAAEESEEEPALPDPVGPSSSFVGDLSLGVIGVGFEHLVEQVLSFHIAAQFYSPWYQEDARGTYGFGGEVRVFWYFAASGFEGAYLSPGFRAGYVFREDDIGSRDGYMLGGRMTLGYGWLFDNFHLRLGIGGQYETVNLSEIDGQESEDFGSPYLAVDIYVGWAG